MINHMQVNLVECKDFGKIFSSKWALDRHLEKSCLSKFKSNHEDEEGRRNVNQNNTRTVSISPKDCLPDEHIDGMTIGNDWITISQGGVIIKREEDANIHLEKFQMANTQGEENLWEFPNQFQILTIPCLLQKLSKKDILYNLK